MPHRDLQPSDFEGKTIRRFVADAINVIEFHFTDGTSLAIEVDSFGPAGPGMVACDVCATPNADENRSR